MLNANVKLQAVKRDDLRKGASSALRRQGRLPAVICAKGQESVSISVDGKSLGAAYFKGGFTAQLVELAVEGGETVFALPRVIQLHPVTDLPLHVDFMRVLPGSKVTVPVPVRFHNHDKSPGIKRGGMLNMVRRFIEVHCDAERIPGHFDVDLSGSRIGDSIHVSRLTMPEGCRPVIFDRDFTIATIMGKGGKDGDEEGEAGAEAA
jgi:large subunit ribosomal protein L25